MSEVVSGQRRLAIVLVAVSLVSFGFLAGMTAFYYPNTDKPVWMPHDFYSDMAYFGAYLHSLGAPALKANGNVAPASEQAQYQALILEAQGNESSMAAEYQAFAPQHGDANQFETHKLQPRHDDRSQLGFQSRVLWLVSVQYGSSKTKRGGPRRPPPYNSGE